MQPAELRQRRPVSEASLAKERHQDDVTRLKDELRTTQLAGVIAYALLFAFVTYVYLCTSPSSPTPYPSPTPEPVPICDCSALMAEVDKKLSEVEKRLEASIRIAANDASTKIDKVRRDFDTNITSLRDTLSPMQVELTEQSKSLTALSGSLSGVTSTVNLHTQSIEDLTGARASLSEKLANATAQVTLLHRAHTANAGSLANFTAGVHDWQRTMATTVASLRKALDNTTAEMTKLKHFTHYLSDVVDNRL